MGTTHAPVLPSRVTAVAASGQATTKARTIGNVRRSFSRASPRLNGPGRIMATAAMTKVMKLLVITDVPWLS